MAEEHWTSLPAEAESGKTVIVTVRPGLEGMRDAGKHKFRVEVSLDYDSLPDGMPDDKGAEQLDTITEAFKSALAKDKAALLTELYTGDGRRDWIFHTTSLFIFQKLFNRALEALPLFPFAIEAYEDPAWEGYDPPEDED